MVAASMTGVVVVKVVVITSLRELVVVAMLVVVASLREVARGGNGCVIDASHCCHRCWDCGHGCVDAGGGVIVQWWWTHSRHSRVGLVGASSLSSMWWSCPLT